VLPESRPDYHERPFFVPRQEPVPALRPGDGAGRTAAHNCALALERSGLLRQPWSAALAKPPQPDHTGRFQLAQRIHQVLAHEIDHAIEVERLLTDPRYARDVLLVCDALPGSEAPPLARQFRALPLPPPPAANAAAAGQPTGGAPGHAQQPTDWSRDTSGFGVTRPPPGDPMASRRPGDGEPPADPAERRRNWLPRWRDSR
jgi:hypothetical protein